MLGFRGHWEEAEEDEYWSFHKLRVLSPSLELCLWVVVLPSAGQFRQCSAFPKLSSLSCIHLLLWAVAVKGDCGNLGLTSL